MCESRGDEESGGPVQCPPAVVVAEHAANVAHNRCVSPRAHEATHRRWSHGLPARQDRPHCQHRQADRADRAERPPERRAVGTRRQKDVRCQQDQPADRDAAMPDRGPVDPIEPLLHPGQGADEHETDREQQDRFAAKKLPEIAPGRLACRPGDESTRRPCRRRGRRSSPARRPGRRFCRARRQPYAHAPRVLANS